MKVVDVGVGKRAVGVVIGGATRGVGGDRFGAFVEWACGLQVTDRRRRDFRSAQGDHLLIDVLPIDRPLGRLL